MGFEDISSIDDVWNWISNTAEPAIYSRSADGTYDWTRMGEMGTYNLVVGGILVTQTRAAANDW